MRADTRKFKCWFGDDEFAIAWYPYSTASVFPSKRLSYEAIREILVDKLPLEIRTHEGEVLLVPAPDREALIAVAQAHGIPAVRRVDVWGMILEPFVDTAYSNQKDAEARTKLRETGVDDMVCTSMRHRLAKIVGGWNLGLAWNWWGLSLFEAFNAIQFMRETDSPLAWSDDEYREFYWEAMALAERGRLLPPTEK